MQQALGAWNSLAFQNRKSDAVGDWCNTKGIHQVYSISLIPGQGEGGGRGRPTSSITAIS